MRDTQTTHSSERHCVASFPPSSTPCNYSRTMTLTTMSVRMRVRTTWRRQASRRPPANLSCHLFSLHNIRSFRGCGCLTSKGKRTIDITECHSRAVKKSLWRILNYAERRYIRHYNSRYPLITDKFTKKRFTAWLILTFEFHSKFGLIEELAATTS